MVKYDTTPAEYCPRKQWLAVRSLTLDVKRLTEAFAPIPDSQSTQLDTRRKDHDIKRELTL